MPKLPAAQIEICIDSVESAVAAEKGGAKRLELCQNLFEGGTTPSCGLIDAVVKAVKIPVFVIIRPRGADFCYSEAEFGVMCADTLIAREFGASGIVTGVLKSNGTIDRVRMKQLMTIARPLPVTFHRAFDVTRDPAEALETLIDLGVERVLTSGQERTVLEGSDVLVALIRQARGRIVVMPGGGITDRNFARIRALTGAKEYHLSASGPVNSAMVHRNGRVPMGRDLRPPEFAWTRTDAEKVKTVVRLAK